MAEGARWPAEVARSEGVGTVLHDNHVVELGHLHDWVHGSAKPSVVDQVDRSGPGRHQGLQAVWVEIQRVWVNIAKSNRYVQI